MKKLTLSLLAVVALASAAYAGTERYTSSGKDYKQTATTPAPCPQWYADNEVNVSLWGTYAFTGENWRDDTYIEADHGWGGGIDAKYFFHRYFGVGLEGFLIEANRETFDATGNNATGFVVTTGHDSRAVGAVLGTFTLRFPIACTRFAPYIWGGGGAIFGGGERDDLFFSTGATGVTSVTTTHSDSETKLVGQFGGGFEVRITPHIGIINDFSWNVIDDQRNNFGMVRSGINFAF